MTTTSSSLRRFYFIRHGQTDANLNELMCGSAWDIDLNETGRAEAREAISTLHPFANNIKTVCYSPLRRAAETKDILLAGLGDVTALAVPDLMEWDIGAMDQKKLDATTLPVGVDLFSTNPPGGEPHEVFFARVKRGLDFCLQQPGDVLIVAHGGVGVVLLRHFGLSELAVQNATLCQFDLDPKPGVEFFQRPSQRGKTITVAKWQSKGASHG